MTRDNQSKLFLATQTLAGYVADVTAVTAFECKAALANGDDKLADQLCVVLSRIKLGEYQSAMDGADVAGFTAGEFPALIEASRKLGRLMADMVEGRASGDTVEIDLSDADERSARIMFRASKKKADQLEDTLGKIWSLMAKDGSMTVEEVRDELTVKDCAAIGDAVASFKRGGF